MGEPANQAAFAGADGSKDVITGFPLPANRGGLAKLVTSHKVAGAATLANLLDNHAQADLPGRRAAVVRAVLKRGVHEHPQRGLRVGVRVGGGQRDRHTVNGLDG